MCFRSNEVTTTGRTVKNKVIKTAAAEKKRTKEQWWSLGFIFCCCHRRRCFLWFFPCIHSKLPVGYHQITFKNGKSKGKGLCWKVRVIELPENNKNNDRKDNNFNKICYFSLLLRQQLSRCNHLERKEWKIFIKLAKLISFRHPLPHRYRRCRCCHRLSSLSSAFPWFFIFISTVIGVL